MKVSSRFKSRAPWLLTSAVLAVTVMTSCSAAPPSTTASPTTISTPRASSSPTPATVETSATNSSRNGLIKALHARCDVGTKIMHYLATGDNGGDPQLDEYLSKYVGVDAPQARAVADQQIQQCDENLSQQEAVQASAEASANAKASEAAAEAEASAQAAQDKAALFATEQKNCAAIGGNARKNTFGDLCVSSNPGSTTDGTHTSCGYAQIGFQPGGTIASTDIVDIKGGYPGCFP